MICEMMSVMKLNLRAAFLDCTSVIPPISTSEYSSLSCPIVQKSSVSQEGLAQDPGWHRMWSCRMFELNTRRLYRNPHHHKQPLFMIYLDWDENWTQPPNMNSSQHSGQAIRRMASMASSRRLFSTSIRRQADFTHAVGAIPLLILLFYRAYLLLREKLIWNSTPSRLLVPVLLV